MQFYSSRCLSVKPILILSKYLGNCPDMISFNPPCSEDSTFKIHQEQVTARPCIWALWDTSPSLRRPHPLGASCLPGWINNWKGREDGYRVNGIIVVSGGFLKITLTLLTAQVPSYCQRVGLTQQLQKVGKESDAPPGKGGSWWRNTGYMFRGLQFMTSDKPKCKENWSMLQTGSKLAPLSPHTQHHTHKAVIYVGKFFRVTQVWKKTCLFFAPVSKIQVFLDFFF